MFTPTHKKIHLHPGTTSDNSGSRIEGDDDGWFDSTSSESDSSAGTGRLLNESHIAMDEKMSELIPFIPSLLSNDLPPCGLLIQVAYERIVTRLRHCWLQQCGKSSVTDICHGTNNELIHETILAPPFGLKKGQTRSPWRREGVFVYELRWIKYFLAEANIVENEMKKEPHVTEPIDTPYLASFRPTISPPGELHLASGNEDLWKAWHEKKRAPWPTLPDTAANSSQGTEMEITAPRVSMNSWDTVEHADSALQMRSSASSQSNFR